MLRRWLINRDLISDPMPHVDMPQMRDFCEAAEQMPCLALLHAWLIASETTECPTAVLDTDEIGNEWERPEGLKSSDGAY